MILCIATGVVSIRSILDSTKTADPVFLVVEPGLVNEHKKTMERSTMLLMGKSTISMALNGHVQ
jgi:uncharacterized protein YybS (DUF2232 family)